MSEMVVRRLLLFVFLCTASLACIGFLSPPDSLSSIHYFSIKVGFSGTKERVVTSNFSGRIHHMLVNLNTFLLCLLSVSQLVATPVKQLLHLPHTTREAVIPRLIDLPRIEKVA